jgi:mannosyltransferase
MLHTLLKHLGRKKQSFAERHVIIIIIIGAVIAMTLSLLIGLRQSVWFDEAYSILLAKQPIPQLLHLAAIDTHPPLYYLLLKGWASVFGWGEFALRSLSVLAMGGAAFLAGMLVRRLFGARIAIIAMIFVALSPFLIRYGFEIRMYSLGSLIGVAATYALILALDSKERARRLWLYAAYAALVAIGMYTLYYTALLWIAHVVWLVWMHVQRRGSLSELVRAPWLAAYAGAIVLFLPWLPTFLTQMNNGALAPISQAMTLENLLGIVSFNFVYQPIWQLNAVVSLLVLFVLVMIGWMSVKAFTYVKAGQRGYLGLLLLYLLVPVAVLTLVGFMRPMYVERYLAHVAIGGGLFIGVSAGLVYPRANRIGKWLIGILAGVLLIGVMQLAVAGNFNFQRLQHPELRQASAMLQNCTEGTKILAADPYVAIELDYYRGTCPVYFYSDATELKGGYAPLDGSSLQVKNPEVELADSSEIYYVYYGDPILRLPGNLLLTDRTTYGALTIDRLSAE